MDATYELAVWASRDGDQIIISAKGELDFCSAPKLVEEVESAADEDISVCALDLSQVTFIDSEHFTALVSTRAAESKSASSELLSLIESPAFKAILVAARQLAAEQGISEREATERVIQVFRKVDQIWCGYLYQEGVSSVLKN